MGPCSRTPTAASPTHEGPAHQALATAAASSGAPRSQAASTHSRSIRVTLPSPVISHGGRRRITHVSAGLAEALSPFVRVATPGEHRAALTALLLLITATDADSDGGHPTPDVPVDCAATPALGSRVCIHVLAPGVGDLYAALAHEDIPHAARPS
ncbi:hypothetical protein [Streptomyces sp. NRRL B-1677]|uniref:hypothetical protein n=1 Tax=Streptomyces sp. NRRL B-1677 TaxID=2682966 RepID=UPI001E451E78|nr:hypothetical protein [Streptomyces sp. NRRL B-1677]